MRAASYIRRPHCGDRTGEREGLDAANVHNAPHWRGRHLDGHLWLKLLLGSSRSLLVGRLALALARGGGLRLRLGGGLRLLGRRRR